MSKWPKVVLFGDSITQRSFELGGWGASIADQLQRKCDIVNRGFSGYNSRWARMIMQTALPTELLKDAVAMTVFFGANDASLQEVWPCQFVGVQDYADNMKAIVNYLESNGIRKEKILLITPPPIDEALWGAGCKEKGTALNRTLKNSGIYAKACVTLAQDLDVKVIDIWTAMQKEENWGPRFLSDGLHLSADGAGFLYKQLSGFVEDCTSSLSEQFPDWSEVDYANPEKSFQQS
ncbi:isoamyl acetate-hydrolyzing esterase 1 homolog isoform X1 [Strongylocentrotus purpuratus]|uniref:SGNH hydrolase-type esterase domain-containing protein n=1 Tax=Strongylocentrotus purpuratus TaxID=7668 RepID=A0A7M7RH19_STRPU|nr:isoamyl acetate-hydrolyzing esterase 1 homolog isoform X1 [Strongylocentrotus purpuratus]